MTRDAAYAAAMTDAPWSLVSADPDAKGGIEQAFFYPGGQLGCTRYRDLPETLWAQSVVVEFPDRIEKDLEPVLNLAATVGRWEAHNPNLQRVKPSAWNKSRAKPLSHRLAWDALSVDEREVIAVSLGMDQDKIARKIYDTCERLAKTGKVKAYSWKAHNRLDAVSIGLWALGRVR